MNKKIYKRVTVKSLQEMKDNGEKISMLTSYDFTSAGIVDKAGIDVILVGDSASNIMAGHETTLPITLDQMIYRKKYMRYQLTAEVKTKIYTELEQNHIWI